jgi:hypothetical protein
MTPNEKGRHRCHGATLNTLRELKITSTALQTENFRTAFLHKPFGGRAFGIRSRCKKAIVWLALYRLLPFRIATWAIQRGGLRDA